MPSIGSQAGDMQIESGPYGKGVASIDLIIDNYSNTEAELIVDSIHGLDVNNTVYGVDNGKHTDQG